MDTLESVKDASKGFNSNTDESERLVKVNQGKEPTVCVQSPEEASHLMPNDDAKRSSEGCINVVTSNSETKRNLLGTQRLKCRRCGSKIRQRRRHKRVRLGTFDSGEEASEAYFSKKSESEKLEKIKTGKKPIVCLESSKEASSVVANVHGTKSSDGCIDSTVTSNPKAKKNLRGAQRGKRGRYVSSIRDPIRHKTVWLGTFDTAEEASEAYFSKKSEFDKLTKVNQGDELIKRVQSPEEASCLMANDLGTKSSEGCTNVVTSNPGKAECLMANDFGTKSPEGCNNVVTTNPEAKRNLLGTKRLKSGRYGAAIQDPIMHKHVRLGTSVTVEEASEAFLSKKSEFEKLSKGNTEKKSKNSDQNQPQSPVGALLSVDNDQTLATASVGKRNKIIVSQRTTHIIGARKKKSGNYYSVITNPISKKRIRLGTLVTAKEAAQAYRSQKLEFQKLVEAKQQCNRETHFSEREKQDGKERLVDVKQGHETVNLEGFQPESASGASWSEIDVPMSNSSDGESEQRIDLLEISHSLGVQTRKSRKYSSEGEEAVHAYQCKKGDSERSKKDELQEGEEDEDLWMGQWVQLPGDTKEVKISLKLGLPIIDNYGCLLGEFSSLDDLSIC